MAIPPGWLPPNSPPPCATPSGHPLAAPLGGPHATSPATPQATPRLPTDLAIPFRSLKAILVLSPLLLLLPLFPSTNY